ncbi:MAG: Re/Si-specific NAD(P)(+) transhydrogenase subunit alpha [Rhodospirillales bacterium]
MKIAIPKETAPGETRVATSPEAVKKLKGLGFDVTVERGAGADASFSDAALQQAGAEIAEGADAALGAADVVLKVRAPSAAELGRMKSGAFVIAHMNALAEPETAEACAKAGVTAFAMELMPRISRAQSMDVLSSQTNLGGYRAVFEACNVFGRAMPMMMTAAGAIPPAKVFIMGVGVAGLQAIATAKRLGAVVTATDVRPATKEQVESLGGKFLEVDPEMEKDAQTEGGYAKEMPPEYYEKQKRVVAEHIAKQDIVITTALIPGRPAPELVTKEMVKSMKQGAVIVDMAAEAGGNCALTEAGKTVVQNGVTIIGEVNLPGRLAEDASALFARNLFNFIQPHVEDGVFKPDFDDETVSGTLIAKDGAVTNERVKAARSGGAKGA